MNLTREVFDGEIRNGELILESSTIDIEKRLSRYDDVKVRIVIEKREYPKTNPQLGYLFGVVLKLISDHTGDDIESLYRNVFLPQFAPTIIKKWKGKEIESRKRLSQMTSEEAGEFITRIMVEGAELGIIFPAPDKNYLFADEPEIIQ